MSTIGRSAPASSPAARATSAAAVDEFATAIDGMNAAAGSAGGGSGGGSSLQKLKTEMDEIAEAAKTVGSEVGEAFANKFPDVVRSALDGTKKIGDAFSDMVKNIALDIAALLVSQQIKQFLGLLGGAVPALGSLAGFAQQPTVAAGGASLAGGAAGPVSVNIVNNSAAQVSARPVQNAGGTSVEVLVQQEVARAVSSGAIDQQFRQAFGLRRIPAS